MKPMIQKFIKDERGVTALETAIILIAFVVVAAVFAFTILSTGTFMTERSKEAAYSGLAQVRGSMELKGSVVAYANTGTAGKVDGVAFTVANVSGGQEIDFKNPHGDAIVSCDATVVPAGVATGTSNVVNVSYRDEGQTKLITTWNVCAIGQTDGNTMLGDRELFRVYVPLVDLGTKLGIDTQFTIEVKPPTGAVLDIQRTTPPYLDDVLDLK